VGRSSRVRPPGAGEDSRAGKGKFSKAFVAKPDVYRKDVEGPGNNLGYGGAEIVQFNQRIGFLGQFHPRLPVVVDGPLEVPYDKALDPLLRPVREQQNSQSGKRNEHKQGIDGNGRSRLKKRTW